MLRHNHTLMTILFDRYFQWNPNAYRMIKTALPIPREVPVFMPEHEWKEEGVPLCKVNQFNQYVFSLICTAFAPSCSTCGMPIALDCARCMTVTPLGLRICNVCKLSGTFTSDYELFINFGISMKHRIGSAAISTAQSNKKKGGGAKAAHKNDGSGSDDDTDDDDATKKKMDGECTINVKAAPHQQKRKKKTAAARPPRKLKPIKQFFTTSIRRRNTVRHTQVNRSDARRV